MNTQIFSTRRHRRACWSSSISRRVLQISTSVLHRCESNFQSMATRSPKKKPNKRSISSRPVSISMASSQTSRFNFKPVLVSVVLVVSVVTLLVISSIKWSVDKSPKLYLIEVVNEFPHDPEAFTQGLLYAGNGTFFESTGLYGKSSIRKVDLQTGKVEKIQSMDESLFGEGLTLHGERLLQVTWLTKTGFVYDRNNFTKMQEFTHQMQDGWGLATDGKVLFGSDGTSTLYLLDPQTLKVTGKHKVKYNGREVRYLNELEFVNGEVWANVWQTDCIARISHEDGAILGWILLHNLRKGLIESGNRDIDVLNGIAWDSHDNRLFVTGKLWPKLYEIKLSPIKKQLSTGVIDHLCVI